ncbi:hypothetical protein [Sutcliffiella deserti]|uniref:hypothetical protein n=1 Tax=Sutcliffiella deserti TaxID=2875501 RepID=UPI001CC03BEE|nr:hypothetical protein [Sutcliffiella deserti]
MIRGFVFFLSLSFFILSSCQENETITHIQFPDDSKTLVFFTDESNLQEESTYYDAIIDLKRNFPDEVANLKVAQFNNEKTLYRQFNIKNTPSLLVVSNNKVVTQVDGTLQKDEIIGSIEQALNQTEDTEY